ncbi:MAG: hypothetical protein EA425_07115 [Puniceicoccaceae bacterium]|nr:MAG: hypothetical protein EA425_07115 [Puniceicoccaceae bacterium]
MKITRVLLRTLHRTWDQPPPGIGQWQSQPLHQYPEFTPRGRATRPPRRPRRLTACFVEVETEEGLTGRFGPIQDFQASVIRRQLRPFLIGRDPLATEKLHDQMLRLDRHGRSGHFLTGLSSIDLALWDLKGKAWGQPVFRLLGGPVRDRIPAYASMLGFSVEPDEAAAQADRRKTEGYPAQKWFFAHGPASGEAGLEANLALAHAVREAVGPAYPIMFDAFMGWDLAYARRMLRGLEAVDPFWMEEPFPPEELEAFRRLARETRVPLATGEHVYTRWQSRTLLSEGSVAFLQNDPDWTGGITELVKICHLASAFSVPVIAHGHSLHPALAVAASQPPSVVPMVEFLLHYQPEKQAFFQNPLFPQKGLIELPDRPGLGLEIDEEGIEESSVDAG